MAITWAKLCNISTNVYINISTIVDEAILNTLLRANSHCRNKILLILIRVKLYIITNKNRRGNISVRHDFVLQNMLSYFKPSVLFFPNLLILSFLFCFGAVLIVSASLLRNFKYQVSQCYRTHVTVCSMLILWQRAIFHVI